jgi:hypothetical protein
MSPLLRRVSASVLAVASLACGGGEGGGSTPPPPPPTPVGQVTIEPASTSLLPNGTVTLTATTRAATGAVLQGRAISWSSTNAAVASVTQGGLVTALTPGQATISATSEGVSGSALVTVLEPITQVTIGGAPRVKAGDTYTYTATARTASGAVVVRPVAWRVLETTRGSMSANGVLTPLLAGSLTVEAVIDNVAWQVTVSVYDWTPLTSATVTGAFLPADVLVTNKFGQSEYPDLVVGCGSGTFILFVSLDRFVTANGAVAYSFDGGSVFTQTWLESDDFDALIHPGATNLVRKNFANLVAASRLFGFGFGEFQGATKVTIFRVTGMPAAIAPSLAACPGNSVVAGAAGVETMRQLLGKPSQRADVETRRMMGPQGLRAPELIVTPMPRSQEAARVGARPTP